MNIYNKKDKVIVDIDDSALYAGANFRVYTITNNNCVSDFPILVGVVPSNKLLELKLKDGNYQIIISKDNLGDLKQNFTVIYNYLPVLVSNVKDLFCSTNCHECKPKDSELDAFKKYFETMTYLNCLGMVFNMPLTRGESCKQTNTLNEAEEYRAYYGQFNFSYLESIKQIFAYLYTELYVNEINAIRVSDEDIKEINKMFEIEEIEKCIYRAGINIQDLKCKVEQLNCGCNG